MSANLFCSALALQEMPLAELFGFLEDIKQAGDEMKAERG